MRGAVEQTGALFSYLSPEALVPNDHPLRAIRRLGECGAGAAVGPVRGAVCLRWAAFDCAGEAAPRAAAASLLRRAVGTATDGAGHLQHTVPLVHRAVDGRAGLGRDGVHQEPRTTARGRCGGLVPAGDHGGPAVKRLLSTEHFSVDGLTPGHR